MSIGPQASVASQVMPGQQQQQPKPSASATDISMLMKQQQQQQQQQQVGAGFNLGLPGAVMKPGMPEGPNQQVSRYLVCFIVFFSLFTYFLRCLA